MKTMAGAILCCSLLVMGVLAPVWKLRAAAFEPVPSPPMQLAPWSISSTNLPLNLQSAVGILFQTGMADPRGCEYREIEVEAGSIRQASGIAIKTHGWLLPGSRGAQTNYVIGWNGLLYQAVSLGRPANAEADARAMIGAMNPPSVQQKILFNVGVQTYADEDYALNVQWLTPAKAALIFRFAAPDLAEACAQLFPTTDPFFALATDHLWTTFDRAFCAHLRGDDNLAYGTALVLTQIRRTCEDEAKRRGFSVSELPEARFRQKQTTPEIESYFPFLNSLPALFQDQERRHNRKSPLRNPAGIKDKGERIAALIEQLEDVSAKQTGYALDYNLLSNPTVQALVNEGWDAVEPLLQCYEHDVRLTRVVPVAMGWGGPYHSRAERRIVGVRDPAYLALEGILETPQFALSFTGNETADQKAASYKSTAEGMRAYYRRYNRRSRDERLYDILKDPHGRWLESASMLVQPTNQPIRPFISWNSTPWVSPLNPNDTTPLRGEALRSKTNPSVTELLSIRVEEMLGRGRYGEDDAGPLNDACDLALCLAQWDRKAALKDLQLLSDLAIRTLAPTNYKSFCSHMDLAGQLSRLVALRAKSGDTGALAPYAAWVRSIAPEKFFLQPGQILSPLTEFPADPAWKELWDFLFNDEKSVWFNFLLQTSLPDPSRMSSPWFATETWFGTPAINNASFRMFVLRLLRNTGPCGSITGGSGTYWLRQDLSTHRRYGYSFSAPGNEKELSGMTFRTCDFYAWLLANRIQGAPAFELYWPEDKRNAAILALGGILGPNSGPLKTQPFQEP
jgi:hypothetical protein